MKICSKCNFEKETNEFNLSKTLKSGLTSWCKLCSKEYNIKYRNLNVEKLKTKKKEYHQRLAVKENYNKRYRESKKIYIYNKKRNLMKSYGITLDQYNIIFQEQNECCKICNKHYSLFKKGLGVDHCHKTGKVRGLLCGPCNRSIGLLKENIQILQNAIEYLKRSNNVQERYK